MKLRSSRSARVIGGAVVSTALVVSMAACSGDDKKDDEKKSDDPTAESTDGGKGGDDDGNGAPSLPEDVKVPTNVKNNADLRDAVKITTCEATDKGWTASGTAQAPKDGDKNFKVTIFFTTDKATVVQWAKTKVNAKAGETADWSVDADIDTQGGELLCVLRGVA